MSLIINNNMMALNTSRSLKSVYGRLDKSVQRLSSGLRVNSAADDAAGLAIREMMRADIAAARQGIRNAADAVSMIQTADGALGVIDEKLTRMKELAEQAATGTYTTVQRDIINSEYQAMAAEIDRIASATNFNGIKLLDGSVSNQHGGRGIKIHFGASNNPAEDYYFVNIGDARATSASGLKVGGDVKNDVWVQGAAAAEALGGPGCCTGGFASLNGPAGFGSGQTFSYGYNWDWREDDDEKLLSARYLAGLYTVGSSDSLQDLINKVNQGTQSRAAIRIDDEKLGGAILAGGLTAICFGDEAYIYGSSITVSGTPERMTFSTDEVLAEISYDPKLAYINVDDSTFVFNQQTDPLLIAALSRLGYAETEVPGSYLAQEMHDEGIAYVQGFNAPKFQERRDAYIEDNWRDKDYRYQLTGTDHDPNDMIETLLSAKLTVPAGFYNAAAETVVAANASFDVELDIYGDFSNLDSPKGVFTTSASIAALFDLEKLKVTIATETQTGDPSQVRIKAYVNGKLIDESYGPSDRLHKDYFEFAFRAALGRAVFWGGAYELTASTPYDGPPPVDPRDLRVDLYSVAPSITVCDKNITIMKREPDGRFTAAGLAETVNKNEKSDFWAMLNQDDSDIVYLFAKEGGDNNHLAINELVPDNAASFRASHQNIINQLHLGIQNRVAAAVNVNDLEQTILGNGLTAVRFGKEAYVYGNAAVSGTTLITNGSALEDIYDPRLAYIKTNGSTLAFQSNNDYLLDALSRLGLAEPTPVPGSQAFGPINNAMLSRFQNELNSYIQANFTPTNRLWINGFERDATYLNNMIDGFVNTALKPSAGYSGATVPLQSADGHFKVTLPIYGDFSKNIYTANTDLAALFGFDQLEIDIYTERVNSSVPAETQVSYSLDSGATKVLASGPADNLTRDDLELAFRSAMATAFGGGNAYELTGGAFITPTVTPNSIAVGTDAVKQRITLENTDITMMPWRPGGGFTAAGLAAAVNGNADGQFRAVLDPYDSEMVYFFARYTGDIPPPEGEVAERMRESFSFQNVETGEWDDEKADFTLGGEAWARLSPRQSRGDKGSEVWNVALSGRDMGSERDIKIAGAKYLITPGLTRGVINGLEGESFYEAQNAADAAWAGAEVRSQSSAQEALEALSEAIIRKDKMRADLGALQNRLENTMTNLEIQAESLAASESRISDIDAAKEMTDFTKNNVLAQAAAGMLSQANSMNQLALSLLG